MTDEDEPTQPTGWESSKRPRNLLALLATPHTLPQLTDTLQATPKYNFHWLLTPTDLHPLNN